jgi:hypothetical protein
MAAAEKWIDHLPQPKGKWSACAIVHILTLGQESQ